MSLKSFLAEALLKQQELAFVPAVLLQSVSVRREYVVGQVGQGEEPHVARVGPAPATSEARANLPDHIDHDEVVRLSRAGQWVGLTVNELVLGL